MKLTKIKPQFLKKHNPRIGLITLSSDFRIEKDFNDVIHGKNIDLFKRITSNGGYSESLKNDGLFNEILLNSKREKKQYSSGEKILVGFNKYIDE